VKDESRKDPRLEELSRLKRRLAELEESVERYKELFENARDIILIFDLKGNITAVNKAVTAYGFSKDDLVGKNMLDFVARPRLLQDLERIAQGSSVEGEVEFFTPKGLRVGEYRSTPIERNGKVIGFQTILRDVTARKKLEEKLAAFRVLGNKLTLLHDEKEIAQAAVDAAHQVLRIKNCSVWLADKKARKLVRIAHTKEANVPEVPWLPLDGEQGIIATAVRSGESIYLPDVTEDSRYISGTAPARSELCIPLKVGDEIIGALNAESEEFDAFSPEDRKLLEALANATAVGLYNALLFEEVCKLKEFNEYIIQNTTEGIVLDDVDGIITFVNPALARMLGYTPEELIGRHWTAIIPADKHPVIRRAIKRRRRGKCDRYEVELLCKDGKRLPVLVSGSPRFEGGQFAGTQAVIADISDLKKVEKALRESEERLRTVTEEALVGVYLFQDDKFCYVNPALAKIFGYSPEELIKRLGPADLAHPDDRPLVEENIRRRLEGGEKAVHYTFRGLRKDGRVIHCEVLGHCIEYQGRPAVMGNLLDITERVRAVEESQRSHQRLRKTLDGTVRALSRLTERRDPYTAGHQERVAELACAIAREMGLSEDRIGGLRVAGLLHDIGKTSVPAEILTKPTVLTEFEFGVIKGHVRVAYDILSEIDFPWPVAEIVLQHHERLDGSGYPQGLKDDEILLEARILAVADVVEAMSSHRPYRPARSLAEVLEELERGKGTLYDPEVVEACLRLFSEGSFSFERDTCLREREKPVRKDTAGSRSQNAQQAIGDGPRMANPDGDRFVGD